MLVRNLQEYVCPDRFRSGARRLLLMLPALAMLPAAGCGNKAEAPVTSRVILKATEFLEEPQVGAGRNLFKPALRLATDAVEVAAFRLAVHAGTDDLFVQARGRTTGQSTMLSRIEPPAVVNDDFTQMVQAAASTHAAQLAVGVGIFWIESPAAGETHELAVILPEPASDPFWSIRVSPTIIEGVLIAGAEIELVEDFFYLLVVGDSVQWGNGLDERDKMSTLVSATLEAELKKGVVFQRYAHSGATIYEREGDGVCQYNCFGEVPKANTAILDQVDQVQRPDLIELVIADGCINDVNVGTIVNPSKKPEEIIALTQPLCDEGMTLLLRKLRTVMPAATIVVTGYFQIVSPVSDVLGLNAWLQAQGQSPSELTEELVPVLTANSIAFLQTAHASLRHAIDAVSSETQDLPPIAFADPGFGEANAVFAPDAWLWGMTSDAELVESLGIGLDLAPMDDTFARRLERCLDGELSLTQLIVCLYASVGHPTPAGAEAYAAAIVAQLRQVGVLPSPPP